MSNSKPYLVINGYVEKEKVFPDYTKVVNAAGESLMIESKKIIKNFPIEASGEDGLNRIFIEQDANIWLGISVHQIQLMSRGNSETSTILKWYDDGGTISKSRDDGFASESQL